MPASTAVRLAASCLVVLLSGCASAPPPAPPAEALFHDELFAPPGVPVRPDQVLASSPVMREHLTALQTPARRREDPRRLLLAALAGPRDERLRLEYDASVTRTAAEAFEARRGNCLSLVLVTAALAHELGVPIRYQSIEVPVEWLHAGGLALAVGHVNVAIEAPLRASTRLWDAHPTMVVDFLPPPQAERLRSREIGERTVIAMFLNNRAVETLADERPDEAYWSAREALRQDPSFDAAALTLAVVYRQRHRLDLAAAALERVLDRDPWHADALANLVLVRREQGRGAEADALARRLAGLGNAPPFSAFDAGVAAYREGRYEAARHWFGEAVRSGPAAGDAEFWLARTWARLDDLSEARRHLDRALAAAGGAVEPARHAAKLARLKALADAPSP